MKSKNKNWNIISAIVLAVLVVTELLFLGKTFMLDMLPLKLFVLLPLLAVIGTTIVVALMFVKSKEEKDGKKSGNGKRITAYILSLIAIIGCLIGFLVINKADETIKAVTDSNKTTTVMGVYVLNEDKAHSIKDAKGYTFAYTDAFDEKITKQTIKAIDKELAGEWELERYDSIFYMIDALYEKRVDAIILNASRISLLEEMEMYSSFEEKVRLIYEYRIEDETVEKVDHDFDATQDPFIAYISGSDTRDGLLTKSRSDVNILAVVNPKTKQILLINTPRDYYVPNPRCNGNLDKLTHCGIYGIDCSIDALADLYKHEIKFYGQVNFAGFKKLIDSIGGVDIHSDISVGRNEYQMHPGMNHLNGTQALAFVRDRYSYAKGDNVRGQNQMKVIQAVVNKLSSNVIIANYASILDSVQGMFATNMSNKTISKLIKMQLTDMAKWDVLSYAVTGRGGMDKPCSSYGQTLYVMYPNMNTVQHAKELIDKVYNNDVLTQEDLIVK